MQVKAERSQTDCFHPALNHVESGTQTAVKADKPDKDKGDKDKGEKDKGGKAGKGGKAEDKAAKERDEDEEER